MSRGSRGRAAAWLLGALGLAAAGWSLAGDRPGLRQEIFAHTGAWEGSPVAARVAHPELTDRHELRRYLHDTSYFSVRWEGRIAVARSGAHRFRLRADETAYLALDGKRRIELAAPGGAATRGAPAQGEATVELAAGLHRIEIGLAQTRGPARLALLWAPPGEAERPVDADRLYAGAAGPLRRFTRWLLAGAVPVLRRLLGAALLLGGVLLLRRLLIRHGDALRRRVAPRTRSRGLAALRRGALVVLGMLAIALVYVVLERAAGSPFGFDDSRYMDVALFGKKVGWLVDRYAHIYLVKGFQALAGGDPFAGAEMAWAFLMTGSVAALALGVRGLGPGLQLRTLAVVVAVLLAQRPLFLRAGTVWADYSVMFFLTAAVAVYLHRLSLARVPRFDLHAVAIGVLSLGAIRAKPTGAIVLWLLLLLLWENGRLDPRGFLRRAGLWAAGLAVAQGVIMALDLHFFGDPLFSIHGPSVGEVIDIHVDESTARTDQLIWVWIDQVWPVLVRQWLWIPELLPLGLLVLAAAFTASATGQRIELRLLHLMPIAYLAGLTALQLRDTYGALTRHLFPIVPTACLLGGALATYAGLERVTWRELTRPRLLIPAWGIAALTLLVLLPGLHLELSPTDLGGPEALERLGVTSTRELAARVALPVALVLLALAAPLLAGSRPGRLIALATALLVTLGAPFADTLLLLETRREDQRSQLLLYPWRAFGDEIRPPAQLVVAPEAVGGPTGMFGPPLTAGRVAKLFFRTETVNLTVARGLPGRVDYAIGRRSDVARWREDLPALDATAVTDPRGRLILVRPAEAARLTGAETGPP